MPLEKDMYRKMLKEKEAELGEILMPRRPSWVGKKPEEMSPDERKEHDRYLERFVWKEGDLEYVGHKPLTEEQKELVKKLKMHEELEKEVIYYYNIRHSRFYYNTGQINPELAVWVDSAQGMKDMLATMLRGPFFMGRDRKQHKTKEELELFFLEYIPRVFGKSTEVKKVKSVAELPPYNWEEHVDESLYRKSKGVEYYINKFMEGEGKNKGRHHNERYASFDYCYNYFYSFYRENRLPDLADESNIQMSCLQLGFYLASWGMLRGSSFLIEKSVKHYEKLIKAISKMDPVLWEIDVDSYNEKNIDLLMDCKDKIIDALGRKNAKHWDTLVTKIMLGVFANVPAFDTYFCNNMKVYSFNKEALLKIKRFYQDNKDSFDQFEIHTFDYSGGETDKLYTKAKLVDMCGFIGGND